MPRRLCILIVALGATLCCVPPVAAQVYRWVDKDGKVHYSDQKPPDRKADELAIQSQPSDPQAAEKTMAELIARNAGLAEEAARRDQMTAEQAQAQEQKRKLCEAARADLQLLMAINRHFSVDAQGERVYDTDAQLEGRRAQARARVAQNCG
jgi:hypothetical protein